MSAIENAFIKTLQTIIDNSEAIKNLIETILSICGAFCAIGGIRYIRTLRKKTEAATFGYWQQFLNRLCQLKIRLCCRPELLDNLYSDRIRDKWNNDDQTPNDEELKEFKSLVEVMLKFLADEPEQMPAYPGWCDDYSKLVEFLDNCIFFDILDPKKSFKFDIIPGNNCSYDIRIRTQYCNNICSIIDRLTDGIKDKQSKAEKKLYPLFYGNNTNQTK